MSLKIQLGAPTIFRCLITSACVVTFYVFLVLSPFEKLLDRGHVSSSPRFIDTYKDFKLYEYMGHYYGLDAIEDPIAVKQISTISKYPWVAGPSIERAKRHIDRDEELLRANKVLAMFRGFSVSSTLGSKAPHSPNSPIWIAQSPPQYPEWIVFSFLQPVVIKNLGIHSRTASGNEHIFHPKDFVFQGSLDGLVWLNILRAENTTYDEGDQWHEWDVKNITSFLYYRIYITAGNADYLTIFEVRLA